MSIAVVVGTYNRAPLGGPNYLSGLLASLWWSGLWTCGLLNQDTLQIVDGGSASLEHLDVLRELEGLTQVQYGVPGQHGNETFLRMAQVGIRTGADYIVTCEDDIVVCVDFLPVLTAWLEAQRPKVTPMMPLYSAYGEIQWAHEQHQESWQLPIQKFYGTQMVCWQFAALCAYVDWYEHRRETGALPQGYWDILMRHWYQETYPSQAHVLVPVPNLCQHVGTFSALGLHDRFHTSRCVRPLA